MSEVTPPPAAARRLLRWVVWIALVVVLVAGGGWWWRRSAFDPVVGTPLLAIEAVQARQLYFNAGAYPWLKARRPELLPADALDVEGERVRGYVQAVKSPKLFRQLDRQHRFDALLLIGNPSDYRPLLDHLVETEDFRPEYVDHWAIILRRGAGRAWTLDDLAPVRARLARLDAARRAAGLAEVAVRLVGLRRIDEARTLLDEAQALEDGSPTMWNARGVLHAQRGEWKEALAAADRALQGRFEPLSAVATKAQALYAMKKFGPAYDLSRRLIEQVPDDPGILFYHAKIAHEAHAYRAEIDALEHLIALADAARRPTAGYRIYLGQAYAAVSDGRRAIEAFTRALADPDLPRDQREFAEETIRRIRSRADL